MKTILLKINVVSVAVASVIGLGFFWKNNFQLFNQAQARNDGQECRVENSEPKLSFTTPDGTEFAFINRYGYFGFNGELIENSLTSIEEWRGIGYNCSPYGEDELFENDYYDYRINNANGITLMAVVKCRGVNHETKVFVRDYILEGGLGDNVGGLLNLDQNNQFIIINDLGDFVAGIANLGEDNNPLILSGCYENQFQF